MKNHIYVRFKPYLCTVCNKSFAWKDSLNRHIRTHSHEKPYICAICNKSFSRKESVERHLRIHISEKPI
ncbi:hypothetical protein L9F63_019679 [Diploptera punctata]|uniref:C2H2-type domain-containing protein n=1 Tax=Diploptera punctata TaxID=6984 RepID=A0AAD7ZUL0_DIPPU|nr:hypothetical protein L9F63_019679 [Diploptera punctata]